MNNLKKIGLTALAGSLVVTSAFAGELTASGSASMGVANITGTGDDGLGKNFSMANSVYLNGSTELDNGMTVSMYFELDAGVDTGTGTGPFDNHSVTVSSDTLGTLVLSGHGGSSAQSAGTLPIHQLALDCRISRHRINCIQPISQSVEIQFTQRTSANYSLALIGSS